MEANSLDRWTARDLARLTIAMGPDLWSWQRALRLTRQSPWRASPNQTEVHERTRATEQMLADIATWERALLQVDADTRRATLYGYPVPPPLEVPAAVMRMIEQRRAAALEQAARRRQRADEGGGGPAPHPPPPGAHRPR